MVITYLRVSTEKQFLANQKEEILQFIGKDGLLIDRWYTETINGNVSIKDRKLSELLKRIYPEDTLVVAEISRLSRTLPEIMTILNFCIKKQMVLYSTKEGYMFRDDINSKVLEFAFRLVAEIERNLISMRTEEAFARGRQGGMTLGRRKRDAPEIKLLSANKRVLTKELSKGTTYLKLVKKMGVSRTIPFRSMKTMY